jgi:hypothetical protein
MNKVVTGDMPPTGLRFDCRHEIGIVPGPGVFPSLTCDSNPNGILRINSYDNEPQIL